MISSNIYKKFVNEINKLFIYLKIEKDCSICLNLFSNNYDQCCRLECGHYFHITCVRSIIPSNCHLCGGPFKIMSANI